MQTASSGHVTPKRTKDGASRKSESGDSISGLFERLGSSIEGLDEAEAKARLTRHGPNELAEKRESPLLKFLSYFWGPIPWMIEIAAVLSAVVGHWADLGIILTLLVVNAAVGFWEEHQAGNTIAALKAKLSLTARVKRGGAWKTIPARELVPGDLVRMRLGDVAPADTRLVDGDPVEVDQSALTGESLPVTRAVGEVVYSGSVIKQGEIDALVEATGKDTYFGRTARLVETAETVGHFQRAVLQIGNYLIVVALGLVALILGVALFRGDRMLTAVQFALILTVASIPVAMPTVLSVTMAVGARKLAQSEAVVSKLASIEELAGMDVLCSDKTGTLTQNRLTAGAPLLVSAKTSEEVIWSAALASRAEDQDAIDQAVLSALKIAPEGVKVVHFVPFDPVHKRTEATLEDGRGKTFKVSKGAPQVILALAPDAERVRVRARVDEALAEFASRGFRSLGVARTDDHGKWIFLGIIPLYDPPREDSKEIIAVAQRMGIDVKMVTGDQVAIAKEIARRLNLGTSILDASVFDKTSAHEAGQLADVIEQSDGFAQVFPEHKYHIVEVLQRRGHIVGMTGDGVNDAPALKKADAGIAVSGATDAARSAADIVLLSPGLSVIIEAVEESRRIFRRMTSYAIYRIAETLRVLLFMTLSILVFNFYPVTAVMIVLLALLNDGAILSIAYDNAKGSERPEAWNMRVVLGVATVLGITGVITTFGLFYLAEREFHIDRETIRSFIYLKLSVAGHFMIFATRTNKPLWSSRPSNILLVAVFGTQIAATLIAVYGVFMAPIGWVWALLVWSYSLAELFVSDRAKLLAYRIFEQDHPGLLTPRSRARVFAR